METKVIQLDADNSKNIENIKAAADCILAGGLVVFPTETVYGIACVARTEPIVRLNDIKQRDAQKHYSLHIANKKLLGYYIRQINPTAQKLINSGWPGPITIVFELSDEEIAEQSKKIGAETAKILYKDNSIGIRCPEDPVAVELLGNIKSPVVAPSANSAGRMPSVNAEDAKKALDGQVDMILDGGECKYKKGSTVVKIGKSGWEVLRVGVYNKAQIGKMLGIQILFICTGNTCRSPMAEGLGRKFLAEKLGCKVDQLAKIGYKIISAGLMAVDGARASSEAVKFCSERGVDIIGHRSRELSKELIARSDYIFALSENHRRGVIALCPEAAQKCILLDEDRDVSDPIGGDEKVYKACGKIIEKAVKKRIYESL